MLFLGCGGSSKQPKTIIGEPEVEETTTIPIEVDPEPVIIAPVIPNGAVTGDFNGDSTMFYAHVTRVDTANETTYVSFENKSLPQISIPQTYGGSVSTINLDGFDRDLLLVTAKLKDPNFLKYYLYVLRDNQWKPVMNGFAIHITNLPSIDQPLKLNPNNPNEINRYYSVFNLDSSSPLGYTWLLLEEDVPIENR
jgi:hypothetical protein